MEDGVKTAPDDELRLHGTHIPTYIHTAATACKERPVMTSVSIDQHLKTGHVSRQQCNVAGLLR
jgi:hypothetical protein